MVQPLRRILRPVVSAGCAVVAASALGCGANPEASTRLGSQPIVGGEVATEHRSVFGLVIHKGRSGATCTATLIAPNLLLTARHCVAPSPSQQVICGSSELGEPYPAEDLYAANAVAMRDATRWFQGASVHVPTEGNDTCGYDMALIVLNENVPLSVATPSVPRIDRDVVEGEGYVAVGYGIADNGESGDRMMRNDLRVSCAPGSCGFGIRVSEFRGDSGICEGDSGGPAFDADGKVVGVVSRGADECDSPVYGSVSAWKELITVVALQAAARGRYEAPFWAKSGVSDPPAAPEPSGEGAGAACTGSAACAEGLVCYRAGSDEEASCVARCSSDDDCAEGLECRAVSAGDTQLCLAPRGGSDTPASSCAIGNPGTQGGSGAALLGLATLLGLSLRRTRRKP